MTAATVQPAAAVDDPQCRHCPGGCRRSGHVWRYERGDYRYTVCRIHRRCAGFEPAEPEPDAGLPPLPPRWSAPLSTPAATPEPSTRGGVDEAGAVSPAAPASQQPANRGAGEVVEACDPQASTTARPTLLAHWDSWGCSACGSRRLQPDVCCGQALEPIRVEIHRRTP